MIVEAVERIVNVLDDVISRGIYKLVFVISLRVTTFSGTTYKRTFVISFLGFILLQIEKAAIEAANGQSSNRQPAIVRKRAIDVEKAIEAANGQSSHHRQSVANVQLALYHQRGNRRTGNRRQTGNR